MRTYVYVDGFNLYFGALRHTPFKWLNIRAMCEMLLPDHEVAAIRYFTARISGRPGDIDGPVRQDAYLRALATIPGVTVHFGHFLSHPVRMPLVQCDHACELKSVKVMKTEEKGSDVNLASYVLRDGFKALYDAAVIVSNDSDLATPLAIAKAELAKKVGILNPHPHPSKTLVRVADFTKQIRKGVLAAAQLPETLSYDGAVIRKPDNW